MKTVCHCSFCGEFTICDVFVSIDIKICKKCKNGEKKMYYLYHDINDDEDLLFNQDADFSGKKEEEKPYNPFTSKDPSILKRLEKLNEYIFYATGKRMYDDDFFEEGIDKINEAFEVLYEKITKVELNNKKHPLYP
jgi:hypothetical protein